MVCQVNKYLFEGLSQDCGHFTFTTKKCVFTMWRDVGKGDLHEALQGHESQTGKDDQPQELTRFT